LLGDDFVFVFFASFVAALLGVLLLELGFLTFAFGVGDFLQTSEVFTGLLVELLSDIIDDVLDTGEQNELESVDSSVGDFESLVESDELGLQRSDRDQNLEEFGKLFSGLQDCATTT